MKRSCYLTTPLYYVNDEPHIGHAYTTVLADVIARYHRLFGENVHLLTGTDEHGQKVAEAAAKLGRSPLEHCDVTSKRFIAVWEKLGIDYQDFIRTTEPRHTGLVNDILTRLNEKGDIYKQEYEGWYSVFEERFFTEKDLVNGKDPIGGRPVEKIKEANYFFRMSSYQEWLIEHYEKHPDAVLPSFRLNEVLGFLRQPLGDLCISRPKSRLSWGIPIPWDDDYVTYVWFDALLNYYTGTVHPPEGTSPEWPADYHLIGKDILTTHAVYWPIMLHAAGLEPPRHILAHGWWMAKDAEKMSKSRGNVVKPLDLADLYGADSFRYYLMRDMVVGLDANFSEEMVVKRLNSDLANDLGNLLNRVTKMLTQHFEGVVPDVEWDDEDSLIELAGRAAVRVHNLVEELQIHAAIEETLQLVRATNREIAADAPWTTVKTDRDAAGRALARAAEAIRIAATLLAPVMPEKCQTILTRLGIQDVSVTEWEATNWGDSLAGRVVTHDHPVFPRYTAPLSETGGVDSSSQGGKPSQQTPAQATSEAALISFDEFKAVDLRTALVLEAEEVEKSDKLLKLQIDVGGEKRQLVAGIKQYFTPEQIVGKTVIVVANLKPAKIFGIESQGMMLAVRNGDSLTYLAPAGEVPSGLRVS